MSSLAQWLLPAEVLIPSLNAAVAATLACGMALALSRRTHWSLPMRHALLVAALATTLLAPLVISLVRVPAMWSVSVAAAADGEPSSRAIQQPLEGIHSAQPLGPPGGRTNPLVGRRLNPANNARLTAAAAGPGSDASSPASLSGQQPSTTAASIQVAGTILCGLWLVGIVFCLARDGPRIVPPAALAADDDARRQSLAERHRQIRRERAGRTTRGSGLSCQLVAGADHVWSLASSDRRAR